MAMRKKYKSKSDVRINVKMAHGGHRRVEFAQLTGGGSELETSDEELQSALESHPWHGKAYCCVEQTAEDGTPDECAQDECAQADAPETAPEVRRVEVSDREKAKDYLAEHYGEARSNLRSMEKLRAAAARHNIEFDFGTGAGKEAGAKD